jgi:cellulose synthase (UDP-forming)
VDIVEPTAIAALNMNWPGSKLTVHILDDGKRPEMARLVRRLNFQCKYMQVGAARCWLGCCRVWRPRLLLRLIGSRSAAAEATTASISFASGDVCQSCLPEMLRTQACMPCLLQVLRLMPGCRFACLQREANIVYLGREKVKGVPHHAKAGNINNCLLKEGAGKVGHGAVAVMRPKAPGQMQPVGHVRLAG